MTRLIALGDSYSCGEGVGVQVHLAHTWSATLAHALGLQLELHARPGARVGHVRTEQLPHALANPAPVVTVLAGLNDVIRTGWCDQRIPADLTATVEALRAVESKVVLFRLHDTLRVLPFRLPRAAREIVRHRLDVLNGAVDSLRQPGVVIVDLETVPELRSRSGWAVDRLHPSISGHRGIAASAAAALVAEGVRATPLAPPSVAPAPGQLAEVIWFTRHGAPYLMKNAFKQSAKLAKAG